MMRFTVRAYIGDAVLCVALIAVLTAAVIASAIGSKMDNQYVKITVDGKNELVLSLDDDETEMTFDGVTVKISDGRAYISDSDCPDGVCMKMHGVDKKGGGAVCLPNRVVLEPLSNGSETDYIVG